MSKRKNKMILVIVMGFLATAFALSLLSALGVPTFDVGLVALFGEGSIWASVLSLLLLLSIALGVGKVIIAHRSSKSSTHSLRTRTRAKSLTF